MMISAIEEVDADDVMQQVTVSVRITGVSRFKVRAWIAMKMIRLGCRILRKCPRL